MCPPSFNLCFNKFEFHSYDYANDVQNQDFFKELEAKADNKTYKQMQDTRKRLPSMGMKEDILDLINKHQIVVISGETGNFHCYYFV